MVASVFVVHVCQMETVRVGLVGLDVFVMVLFLFHFLFFSLSLSLFISLCRFLSIFSEDIDECAEGIADCDPLVNCTNLPGTYKCGDCPPGYRTLDYGRRCEGLKSIASSTSTH